MVREQLHEIKNMGIDPVLKGVDLTGLDKMDIAELEMLKHSYKKRGYYTPEEKERIHVLQLKMATEKIRLNEPERRANRKKAARGGDPTATLETIPVDWSDPLSGDTVASPTIDPLGRTQAGSSQEKTTRSIKKIRKENKIITQSHLRQIIKEELEVILTDDEVKEMFGIDITEEKEGSVKIKT